MMIDDSLNLKLNTIICTYHLIIEKHGQVGKQIYYMYDVCTKMYKAKSEEDKF